MSKTYRKSYFNIRCTEVEYVNSQMKFYSPFRLERRYKTRKQYDAERRKAEQLFEKKQKAYVKKCGKLFLEFGRPLLGSQYYKEVERFHPRYVRRYYYIEVPQSLDEYVTRVKKEYQSYNRDGTFTESKRKKAFRKDCARTTRRMNKRLCNEIVQGEEWDHESYPSRKHTKHLIWSYW